MSSNEQLKQDYLNKMRAYKSVFEGDSGEKVLADLAKFCRADMTTFEPDDNSGRISAFREGRREVYLRIKKFMEISEADIDRFNFGDNKKDAKVADME